MTGLVGMTIPGSALATGHTPAYYDAGKTQDQADNIFTGFVGRSIAGGHLAVTKKFWNLSDWSTTKNNIANYAAYGTTVLFALKPLFTTGLPLGSDFTTSGTAAQKAAAAAEKTKLANFLAALVTMGFTASTAQIELWQEPANGQNFGGAGAQGPIDYNNMLRTYGSTVTSTIFPLMINVNYDGLVSNATNYANAALGLRAYGGAGAAGLPVISGIYLDFYTNSYYGGHNLRPDTSVDANGDSITGIADAAGLPFGLAEFGCVPKQIDPAGPPYPLCTAYMQYILSFMRGRLTAGKQNLHTIYYDGVGPPSGDGDITSPIGQDPFCVPTGASEFRVPLWQAIYDGLAVTSPAFAQRQTSQNFLAASGVLSLWNNQATPPSGGAATLAGSLLVAKFELSDCTSTTTVTGPAGWIQVPHEGKAGTATGQARTQIWYYPNCQPGLYGDASHLAVFTCSNTAATFKGKISEWTTPVATIQALDRSGGAGAVASSTSPGPVACTAANVFTGDLGIAMFGAVLSGGTTGQSWTVPSGWTGDGLVTNLTQVFHSLSEPALGAGTTSVTGSITLGTWTMTSWAGTVATFYSQAALPLADTAASTLSAGTVSAAYSDAITADGGVGPYTVTLASGSLPAGLSLASTGAITGTPSAAGTYTFHTLVTDCSQQSVTKAHTIVVATGTSTLAVGTTFLPAATAGVPYTATLTASGGSPPYAWTVT